jgi:hypothetical protein
MDREYLKALRKELKVNAKDKIDKRFKPGYFGYLAPDNQYYKADNAYDAEIKYIMHKYGNQLQGGY